jgi:hypothetical protein
LARRYIGAPDWEGALRLALNRMGDTVQPYSYFVQKFSDDKVKIGSAIGDAMFEWAWSKGKDQFDPSLFESSDRHIFLKTVIADHLQSIMPSDADKLDAQFKDELSALNLIRPHAIITTNYDSLLETVFQGYEPIVGKGVLRYDLNSFGEVFHIHGISTDAAIIVITSQVFCCEAVDVFR